MVMSMEGWQTLNCSECRATEFLPTIELIYREGQGTTTRHKGYKCAACGRAADTGALVQKAKVATVQQKIKDLEAEIPG